MFTTMYRTLPNFYFSVSSSQSVTLLVFGHRAVTVVWLIIYSFPDCSICRALMLFMNRLEGFERFCEGLRKQLTKTFDTCLNCPDYCCMI
jgi:hypothetical protein